MLDVAALFGMGPDAVGHTNARDNIRLQRKEQARRARDKAWQQTSALMGGEKQETPLRQSWPHMTSTGEPYMYSPDEAAFDVEELRREQALAASNKGGGSWPKGIPKPQR